MKLESYFEFEKLGTNWRTEILAGFTTFLTMAYIIFVNPSILAEAGMPYTAVVAATCFSSAVASLLMGFIARYPIALAPGMGLNAYFTYTVVKGMGFSWQVALGAVFLSGIGFLLLTIFGIRQFLIRAIPRELYAAIAGGIGLFIALIGFLNAGLVVRAEGSVLALGDLTSPTTALAVLGLAVISSLMARGVRPAILLGILITALIGFATGVARWQPAAYDWKSLTATAFQLDLSTALHLGFLEIVFVFLFVDLFDNMGTLLAVGQKAGLFGPNGHIPRLNRILTCDSLATIVGSLAGTSTVVSYIESTAGVAAGGRSGVTAVVTGLLFLVALFFAPLAGAIPSFATAPALIIVGCLMMTTLAEINWHDPVVSFAAFVTFTSIPLTFSIANGMGLGLISYAFLKLTSGQGKQVNWFVYVLAVLFAYRFVYMAELAH